MASRSVAIRIVWECHYPTSRATDRKRHVIATCTRYAFFRRADLGRGSSRADRSSPGRSHPPRYHRPHARPRHPPGGEVLPRQPRAPDPRAGPRARPLARVARRAARRARARGRRDRARRSREPRPDRRAPLARPRAGGARLARRVGNARARHLSRRAAARVLARCRRCAGFRCPRSAGGRSRPRRRPRAIRSCPRCPPASRRSSGTTTRSTCPRARRSTQARSARPIRRPGSPPNAWALQFHLEVGPGTIDWWTVEGAHELEAKGVERAQIMQDTAREGAAYVQLAREVAHRFLAVAESRTA